MKNFWILCFTIFAVPGHAQHIVHSIYLIGDAGLGKPENISYQELLKNKFDSTIDNSILFLGDNIYPHGMPDRDDASRTRCEEILLSQAALAKDLHAKAYFLPGNHDWKRGRKTGWRYLMNQQDFIDSIKYKNISFTPRDGCPGPVVVPMGNDLTLITIDSQWFLQKRGKPKGNTSECYCKTEEEFETAFRMALEENKDRTIIVAAHHPIFTYGEHGGVYPLMSHIFPLVDVHRWLYIPMPIVGSLYPLYRTLIGHRQDTQHPASRAYRKLIMRNLERYSGSLYVSGHEHALQHAQKENVQYIVSGSSVKKEFVRKKRFAQYASHKIGFARIDHYSDGSTQVKFFENDTNNVSHQFEVKK